MSICKTWKLSCLATSVHHLFSYYLPIVNTCSIELQKMIESFDKKARPRFELGISSLLVRRFNQLSHRAADFEAKCIVP